MNVPLKKFLKCNIHSYSQVRTLSLPVRSAVIKEHTVAKEVQQKDVKSRRCIGNAQNLANKTGKDISATGNCMSKGTESRKGVVDTRTCGASDGRNVGSQGRCVRKSNSKARQKLDGEGEEGGCRI